MYKKSVF
nr:unnamed protein product [Callosobruchus analis]